MSELKTYYVTAWALTKGILKVQGELVNGGKYVTAGKFPQRILFEQLGTDVFETLEQAEAQVKILIEKKLASLKKQLLEFETDSQKTLKVSEWP